MDNPMLKGNKSVERAIDRFHGDRNEKNFQSLIRAIRKQMAAGKQLLLPVEYPDPEDDQTFQLRTVTEEDGKSYFACFTGEDALQQGEQTAVISYSIDSILELAIDQDWVSGIVINPFGTSCRLPKGVLQLILDGKPTGEDDWKRENFLLEKAICFAVEHHAGQLRKGTHIPYIVHPLETMNILRTMGVDTNLLIAGVLHDVIEDTGATHEDILDRFGTDVVSLVDAHTQDKSKSWEERRSLAIRELKKAGRRQKLLVMADKVSNLRSMAADYRAVGDELWTRFNAPREKLAWYYGGIQDALYELQFDPDAGGIYWEMVGLYKDVFVTYYRSEPCEDYFGEHIIQACMDGSVYRLDRGSPEWKPMKDFDPTCCSRIRICREDAEKLEDRWNEPFWARIEEDLRDGRYPLVGNQEQSVDIVLREGRLTLEGMDYGPGCEIISGRDEYEYYVSLDEVNTRRLLVQLRMELGIEMPLTELLPAAFGDSMISSVMMRYCKKKKVKYQFTSI